MRCARRTHNYRRNGTSNLDAVFDVASGHVISSIYTTPAEFEAAYYRQQDAAGSRAGH